MSGIVLVIDTATEYALVEFISEEGTLYRGEIPPGIRNSQYLVAQIEEGLKQLKIELSQLLRIVVGVGPGSYTGIRVGVVTAQSLANFSSVPIVAISTLKAFCPSKEGEFAAVIDAKVSGLYLLKGSYRQGSCLFDEEPRVSALKDFSKQMEGIATLVTPNSAALAPKLQKQDPDRNWIWEEKEPSGELLYRLSKNSEPVKGSIEILYLREGAPTRF